MNQLVHRLAPESFFRRGSVGRFSKWVRSAYFSHVGPILVSERHYEPLSGGRSRIDWGITALMVAVFLVGFFWFTYGNHFPSFYHSEEEIRAKQVISRDWDLHQPLLFASTARILKSALHVPDDVQSVVHLGRTVSAFFAIGSIICLSLAVYVLRNWAAAALLSVLLLLQHQFYDLAHSMSENTALMFGSSLDTVGHRVVGGKSQRGQSLIPWVQRCDCGLGEICGRAFVFTCACRRSSCGGKRVPDQQDRRIRSGSVVCHPGDQFFCDCRSSPCRGRFGRGSFLSV